MHIKRLLIGLASFAAIAASSTVYAEDSQGSSSDIIPYPFGAPPKAPEQSVTPPALPKPELPVAAKPEEKSAEQKPEEKKEVAEKPSAPEPVKTPAEPEKKTAENPPPVKLPEPSAEPSKTEVLNTAPKSDEKKAELPNPKPLPEPEKPSVTKQLPAPVTPEVLKEASKPDAEPAKETTESKPSALIPEPPKTPASGTAPATLVTPEVLKETSKPNLEPASKAAESKPVDLPADAPKPPVAETAPAPITPESMKEAAKPAEPIPAVLPAGPVTPLAPEALKKAEPETKPTETPVVTKEPEAPATPDVLKKSEPEQKPTALPAEPVTPLTPETLKKAEPEPKPAETPLVTKEPVAPSTPEVLKKSEPETKAEAAEPKSEQPAHTKAPASEPIKKEVISSPEPVTVIKKSVMEEPKKEDLKPEVAAEATPEPKTEPVKPKTKKAKKKKAAKLEPRFSETIISPPQSSSNAPLSAFTPETKQVFDVIETSLAKNAPPPLTGKVAVAHDDYVTSLSGYKNPETENIGIKMQVKKSDEDITKLLTNAYNALQLGQYETSVALYKEVLKSDTDNQNALGGLAAAYQKSGELAQAKTIYGKLLSLYPENEEGINNFLSLAAEEAPMETLAKLRQMERVNPRYSVIPAQIAMINAKLGNTEEASRYLKRAISLSPDNMSYRYNLAIILDKAGEKEQAMAFYRQLIDASQKGSLVPGNIKDIQERLTYLGSK